MADHQLKIYVGGRKHGSQREKNVRALALKHYPKANGKEGNISALYEDALNEKYNLDPDTGEPLGNIEMVADKPSHDGIHPPKPKKRKPKSS